MAGIILIAFLVVSMAANAESTEDTQNFQVIEAVDANLDDFLWRKRLIVIFADTSNDPRFDTQLELLRDGTDDLIERDVVVITDDDRSSRSTIRETFRPRGFVVILVGKDGGVKLRKPFPWSVRELSRIIDKMPMRQQEIKQQQSSE